MHAAAFPSCFHDEIVCLPSSGNNIEKSILPRCFPLIYANAKSTIIMEQTIFCSIFLKIIFPPFISFADALL